MIGPNVAPSAGSVSDVVMQQAVAEERARVAGINKAWNYYHGRMPRPLRLRKGQTQDDNQILNLCKPIVDKGAAFLFGQDVDIDVDEGDEEAGSTPADEDSPLDTWLDRALTQNRSGSLLTRIAITGGVTGHVFLRLMLPRPGQTYPRIVLWDTANVSVLWSPDDYEDVVQYRNAWTAIDPDTGKPQAHRQTVALSDSGTYWTITDEVSASDNPRWQVTDRTNWPFSWAPVFHCQNLPNPNAFWGLADLENDVMSVNDGINFTASNIARIQRFHAHPRTWGKGFQVQLMQQAIDDIIVLPSPDAELHNLEMQSDLASSLNFFDRLQDAMHQIARIPQVAAGKLERAGALSGVALNILYQPLLEKTQTKRRLYGDMLMALCSRLLELGGQGAGQTICIHWPELLPRDAKAEAEALTLDQELGVVSKETIAAKRGYDWPTEQARMAAEAQASAEAQRAAFDNGLGPTPAGSPGTPGQPPTGAQRPPGTLPSLPGAQQIADQTGA